MEEFILSHNLQVFNDGAIPTFQTKWAGTIIDVTLGSSHLQDFAENWRVDLDFIGSDHHLITFDITISTKVQRKRDFRKGDWLSFQALMETTTPSDLPCWSPEVLDDELDCLYGDIDSALNSTVCMV